MRFPWSRARGSTITAFPAFPFSKRLNSWEMQGTTRSREWLAFKTHRPEGPGAMKVPNIKDQTSHMVRSDQHLALVTCNGLIGRRSNVRGERRPAITPGVLRSAIVNIHSSAPNVANVLRRMALYVKVTSSSHSATDQKERSFLLLRFKESHN